MKKWDGSIQKRVLRAISKNGGIANTLEIMNLEGLRKDQVNMAGKSLVSRCLVRKKNSINHIRGGCNPSIFTLNPKLIFKINRLIGEIENGTSE